MDLEPATIECEEGSEKATVTVDGETREVTWEGVRYAMERLCEERGWHHGIPMPSATDWGHRFIMAKGSPMAIEHEAPQCFGPEETPILDAVEFVNAWTPRARTVHFYRDSKGTMAAEVPTAELRLRTLLDSLIVRAGAVDWRAELKAMLSLRVKINESQWESYLLSGAFPETSKRSGVMYIFRKCFPTIALREIRLPDGKSKRAFLAALCCHGLGYYEHTFAGCQPPTDDVMGHLMLMRADEHRFWKRSGQHSLESVMAGI
jgi:hypothetical protein